MRDMLQSYDRATRCEACKGAVAADGTRTYSLCTIDGVEVSSWPPLLRRRLHVMLDEPFYVESCGSIVCSVSSSLSGMGNRTDPRRPVPARAVPRLDCRYRGMRCEYLRYMRGEREAI